MTVISHSDVGASSIDGFSDPFTTCINGERQKNYRGGRRGNPEQVCARKYLSLQVESLPPRAQCQMLLCLKPQAVVDPRGSINKIKPGTVITVRETPMLNSFVLWDWLPSTRSIFAVFHFFKHLIQLPVKEWAAVTQ